MFDFVNRVLVRAWVQFNRGFGSYLILGLIYAVVSFLLTMLLAAGAVTALSGFGIANLSSSSDIRSAITAGLGGSGLLLMLVYMVVMVIASTMYTGILVELTSQLFRGYKADLKVAYEWAWRRFWAYFLVVILVGISVGIGMMFLIIPGLLLLFMFSLAPYIVGREEVDSVKALSRSWQLVGGSFVQVLLLGLIVLVVAGVIGFVLGFIPIVGQLVSAVIGLFLMPITGAVYEELTGGKTLAKENSPRGETGKANKDDQKDKASEEKSESK